MVFLDGLYDVAGEKVFFDVNSGFCKDIEDNAVCSISGNFSSVEGKFFAIYAEKSVFYV